MRVRNRLCQALRRRPCAPPQPGRPDRSGRQMAGPLRARAHSDLL